MVVAALVCAIWSVLLEYIEKRRRRAPKMDREAIVASFFLSFFLTVLYSLGFILQPYLDAYVEGTLPATVYDTFIKHNWLLVWILGQSFLLGLIPALAGSLSAHFLRHRFIQSVFFAALAATAALGVRFLVQFSGAYPTPVAIMLVTALAGTLLTSAIALAAVNEARLAPSLARFAKHHIVLACLSIAATLAVTQYLSYSVFYYAAIYPIPQDVHLRLRNWEYALVTGDTKHPITSDVFRDQSEYLPAISFDHALLTEEVQRSPFVGAKDPDETQIGLEFSDIRNPAWSTSVESGLGVEMPSGNGVASPQPFTLHLLAFTNCTAGDLKPLREKIKTGRVGDTLLVPRSALLSFDAYQAWIFRPSNQRSNISLMLPAWHGGIVHVMKVGDRGASIGADQSSRSQTRALMLGDALDLVVQLNPFGPNRDELLYIADNAGRINKTRNHAATLVCHKDPTGAAFTHSGFVNWSRIEDDNHLLISGYLLDLELISAKTGQSSRSSVHQFVVRIRNEENSPRLVEHLEVPMRTDQIMDTFFTSMKIDVITFSEIPGSPQSDALFSGSFGPKQFDAQNYQSISVGWSDARIQDNPNQPGGVLLDGTASVVHVDDQMFYFSAISELSETEKDALLGVVASAIGAFFLFLRKRVSAYDS